MKTIFDNNTLGGLIERINALTPQSNACWGKMDVFQMLRHCTISEEMFLGKKKYERLFIGRLFGKMALKNILKNSEPLSRNLPTHPEFKIKGKGDFDAERKKWILLLKEYAVQPHGSFENFTHPFFGKMSRTQIGQYVHKHTDHHLRQFNS